MKLTESLLRKMIMEEMENSNHSEASEIVEGDFDDRTALVGGIYNAIVRYLSTQNMHIDRKIAMSSDPSFDNMIVRIADMVTKD